MTITFENISDERLEKIQHEMIKKYLISLKIGYSKEEQDILWSKIMNRDV